ncbi:hypothetical protein B0H16DRAFT_1423344 [Mycena metata]|uniref:Uncharacterized protein n=1 Tax=Mycena metata TaxID=1033252 RepID=A0AAD7N1Z3_9AGAR|nr:hypothetical protein B0H16DRAFT_1423344 [Mycena metata]
MHFSVKKLFFLLTSISAINAHDSSSHYHSPSNDIRCPKGSHISFVHNSFTFDAPLHKFTHVVKSFFDITWYGGLPTTAMTGTDNVPGATRFGPVDKHNSFNETLTMYSLTEDALTYTYHGIKFTYALPGFNHSPAHIDAYAETMRFESICAGRATYIDLLTYICSNDTATAYNA